MRKLILLSIMILGQFAFSVVFGQKVSFPKWIVGTWVNGYESNTNNIEYWHFLDDSIVFIKGHPINKSDIVNLFDKYSGFKVKVKANDKLYKVKFTKSKSKVIYEFRLRKMYFLGRPGMTYSLKSEGTKKIKHSNSCYLTKFDIKE